MGCIFFPFSVVLAGFFVNQTGGFTGSNYVFSIIASLGGGLIISWLAQKAIKQIFYQKALRRAVGRRLPLLQGQGGPFG